jgi:hypothetical protein
MEPPSTPCLTGTQNADFTRPLDPSTPYVGDRLPKRSQLEHLTVPGPLPYGGKTRKTTTAATALQEGIDASISEATRTAAILKEFATRTDTFASGYKNQKDQQTAEAISNTVARALVAFYQESFGSTRSPGIIQTLHMPSYASVTKPTSLKDTGAPRTASKAAPKKVLTRPTTSREDYRVLVTLPSTSLLGDREEAFLLRRRLTEQVNGLTMAKIPVISPTRTGWALSPADLTTRDLLLANRTAVLKALGGHRVTVPEVWFDYVVPLIPTAFHGISGEVLVTRDLLLEEAFNQTGETPVRCDMSKHGVNPSTGKASWIISFTKKVRPFHIFNTWSQARLINKKPRINRHAIGGCQGWCNPVKCTRAPLCGHCGSKIQGHEGPTGENCQHKAKCANCWGPYKASHDNCPARPKTKDGRIIRPTKAEIRRIRQAGKQATLAAATASRTLSPPARETAPEGTITSPIPSPTPSLQLQGTKRRRGARITEYENTGTLTPASPSALTSRISSGNSRPLRSTRQQNLNVKLLSRNSFQSNSFGPLEELITTSVELGSSDDEMDDITQ